MSAASNRAVTSPPVLSPSHAPQHVVVVDDHPRAARCQHVSSRRRSQSAMASPWRGAISVAACAQPSINCAGIAGPTARATNHLTPARLDSPLPRRPAPPRWPASGPAAGPPSPLSVLWWQIHQLPNHLVFGFDRIARRSTVVGDREKRRGTGGVASGAREARSHDSDTRSSSADAVTRSPPFEERCIESLEIHLPRFDLAVETIAREHGSPSLRVYRAASSVRPCRESRRDFVEQSQHRDRRRANAAAAGAGPSGSAGSTPCLCRDQDRALASAGASASRTRWTRCSERAAQSAASRSASHSERESFMPTDSSAAAIVAIVSSQRRQLGTHATCTRGEPRSEIVRHSWTRDSASVSARTSPGATSNPASVPDQFGDGSRRCLTTGRPCASASATAIP